LDNLFSIDVFDWFLLVLTSTGLVVSIVFAIETFKVLQNERKNNPWRRK